MHVTANDIAAIDAGARALHALALECELRPDTLLSFAGLRGQQAADAALAQARQLGELESRLRAEAQR